MSFLAKFGGAVLKFVQIVTGIAPIVSAAAPGAGGTITTVVSELNQIAAVVADLEAVGQALNLPGAQKLIGAAPLVAQVINQSALMVGKKINDPVLFQKACTEIAGGMADLLNSLHDNAVNTTSLT